MLFQIGEKCFKYYVHKVRKLTEGFVGFSAYLNVKGVFENGCGLFEAVMLGVP
jgi:hypothetical protein